MSFYQILVSCSNSYCKENITKTSLQAISLESAQETALYLNDTSSEICPYCGSRLFYLPIELTE